MGSEKFEYKSLKHVRVGDTAIETLIMTTEYQDGMVLLYPVIRISPFHDAPFYQDIVLHEWDNLAQLAGAIKGLDKALNKALKDIKTKN